MTSFWHPQVQDAALRTAKAKEQARQRALATATPELATSITEVYKRANFLKPSQVVPLAKAGASTQAVDLANKTAATLTLAPEPPEEKSRNFFQRNFYDPLKKATRYTFAAANFFPEFVQGGLAQWAKPGDTMFQEGWFSATTLGSMLQNPEMQGEGFFASKELMDKQAERARKYRGTIGRGDKAFTAGRASAGLFLPEDSLAYNMLSGLVDGALAWYVDPTLNAGKYLKAYRFAKNAIPDTTVAKKLVDSLRQSSKLDEARYLQESIDAADEAVARGLPRPSIISRDEARTLAGNIDQQKQVWDNTEFTKWWSRNRGARRIEKRIDGVRDEFLKYNDGLIAKLDGLEGNELMIQQAKNYNDMQRRQSYLGYKIQEELFDGTISHDEALRFLQPGEGNEARFVIAEAAARLGAEPGANQLGLFPTDIRDLPGAQAKVLSRFANATVYRVPKVKNYAQRQLGVMSESQLLVRGTPEDRFKAVRNIDRMLNIVKDRLPEGVYEDIIGRAAYAYNANTGSPTAVYETRNIVKDALSQVLEKGYEVPPSVVKKVMKNYDEQFKALRTRISTELGENPGHRFIRSLIDAGLVDEGQIIRQLAGRGTAIKSIDDLDAKIISPTVISELLHNVQVLPDARTLRRLAKDPFFKRTIGRIATTKEGDPRAFLELTEFLQQDVWKPLTLMNPGYIARNLLDGQFHVALAGQKNLAGLFNNPAAFFMVAIGRRAPESIMQESLMGKAKKATDGAIDTSEATSVAQEIYLETISRNTSKWVGDPADAAYRTIAGNDYAEVDRLTNPENHTLGILDQLRMIFTDRVVRRAFFAGNEKPLLYSKEVDAVIDDLNKQPELRRQIVELARGGFRYGQENGRQIRIKPTLRELSDEDMLLRSWVQTEVFGRVEKWKNTPELRVMAAHNLVPYMEPGASRVVVDEIVPTEDKLSKIISFEGKPGVGTVLQSESDAFNHVVIGTRRGMVPLKMSDGTEKMVERDIWEVVPVRAGAKAKESETIFGKVDDPFNPKPYNENALDVINRVYDSAENRANELIPARTGYVVRINPNDQKGLDRVRAKWKNVTNGFFEGIAGATMEKLEKSPIFRQYYYNYVVENADLLSPAEFTKMIDNIKAGASRLGISEEAYVNLGRRDYKKLLATKATGEGTVEQLNEFAAKRSQVAMKGLLFDAAERRNVEDAMRILVPFGAAWREVLTKYAAQFADDPTNFRKVERVFTGLTNVDLENDGTGFFYKDPQSGQYMFNFPLSDKMSQLFTGLTAPLVAPVKGLNVGLTFMPAFGPVGQISANFLLPFVPKENDFRKTFLPYGTPGSSFMDFTPGWLRKTFDAIEANPDKMDGFYSQTYVETVRAMYAKGDYDLSDIDQKEQLLNDARGKAKILSIFRAVNQFVGPAAGSVRFEIDTKEGDVYMAHLVREFQKLQEADYDSSIEQFLDTYGDDMMLYVSGKSRSEIQGLEPTQKFEDWSQENKSLMEKFKNTAAFFAPGGDDFSFQVWKSQVDRGERVRLSADEVIAQAQLMVGSAKYRAARLKFGPYPTREQQAWLREYRTVLNEELPGFPRVASFDPAEFPTFIDELKLAVADPKLQDNEAAQATVQYLERREEALAAAQQAGYVGLSSRAAVPLRNYLASIADELIAEYPEFKRIYEQKLQAELMQYTEE